MALLAVARQGHFGRKKAPSGGQKREEMGEVRNKRC